MSVEENISGESKIKDLSLDEQVRIMTNSKCDNENAWEWCYNTFRTECSFETSKLREAEVSMISQEYYSHLREYTKDKLTIGDNALPYIPEGDNKARMADELAMEVGKKILMAHWDLKGEGLGQKYIDIVSHNEEKLKADIAELVGARRGFDEFKAAFENSQDFYTDKRLAQYFSNGAANASVRYERFHNLQTRVMKDDDMGTLFTRASGDLKKKGIKLSGKAMQDSRGLMEGLQRLYLRDDTPLTELSPYFENL